MNYTEHKAWQAIASALDEDLRRPGQRAFTPEDLLITPAPDLNSLIWSYRGTVGYYSPETGEVAEYTDERSLTDKPDDKSQLRGDVLGELTDVVSSGLKDGLTKEEIQADFDGMMSIIP
jgi:hypothetical protein